MSINLGHSSSGSRQGSNSYGYNSSTSSDVTSSSALSASGGQSRTVQDVFGADFFQRLFGGASDAANNALLQAPELTSAARQLFTGGTQFLQSLGGGAGTDYMTDRLSADNPVLQEQIDALREDTGRLFSEQLNPAITSRAVAGGTLGGGRQGVAQGMAIDSAARTFREGATALRAADTAQRDQVAAQVAQNSLSSAATGLGALPGMLDILERGNNAELGVYSSLAGILGGPQVLSQSESSDFARSTSQSLGEAFARSFGEQRANSWGYSRGRSTQFGASLMGGE